MFVAAVLFITSLGIRYDIRKDCSTTYGTIYFPLNDSSPRILTLCNTSDDVLEHELVHICFHNHPHNYPNLAVLNKHLKDTYNEETAVEVIAPCLVENRKNFYKVARHAIR